ncbi:TetR/AcrR family transcriptional regulator [Nonomuraea gerenzanensis]|uniref:Transcriptional regulator, TetR family n=1 Tax=Nonomuraea gerenzanensis TaxID=93944 RepID=A0A1M4EFT8_9ACTN|nr:TetR/AcrR family transcriptional regulator [Nonomuraea gerenzanensis]UBU09261.1 TetR/AcrR family transcriptional regulator [Nonomuraea gerenzanensis]SBO97662.1 Transcriptional regulator, TetR family [Nonomuraea gerenzanensis]
MSGELMESTRRRLSDRQADTVRRLTDAAVEEVRATGFDGFTVRNVARRAGVAPATAYTYFTSKNHLIAEVFWRRLRALPPIPPAPEEPRERVIAVLREIALLVSDEPELAAACTTALLGTDPDVRELRLRIGRTVHRRLLAALRPGLAPGAERPSPEQTRVLNALEFAYAGALVHAGMGYSSYAEMADRLAEVAELLF